MRIVDGNMTKILLVEDDKSLREIYGVRLLAEGYDIVSAGDGEEALAMAIKERPQLIISDVMMPKISGFDLLDILRSTTETKNIRVIMMTALSSDDQRQRGEQLGADRYLVKSQVGIEDVVRVVHEVLEDIPAAPNTPEPPTAAPTTYITPPLPQATTIPQPTAPLTPVMPPTPTGPTYQTTPPANVQPQPYTVPIPPPAGSQPLPVPGMPQAVAKPAQARSKVIQPLNDPTVGVNLSDLLDKEIAKEAGIDLDEVTKVMPTENVQAHVDAQIDEVMSSPVEPETTIETSDASTPQPGTPPTPPENIPTITVDNSGTMMSSEPAEESTQEPATATQPPAQQVAPQAPSVAPQPSSMPVPNDIESTPTPNQQ